VCEYEAKAARLLSKSRGGPKQHQHQPRTHRCNNNKAHTHTKSKARRDIKSKLKIYPCYLYTRFPKTSSLFLPPNSPKCLPLSSVFSAFAWPLFVARLFLHVFAFSPGSYVACACPACLVCPFTYKWWGEAGRHRRYRCEQRLRHSNCFLFLLLTFVPKVPPHAPQPSTEQQKRQ